jgi:hypothetical protein
MFTSGQVREMTGVSLRQIQLWDERGIVRGDISRHKRFYSRQKVLLIALIGEIKKRASQGAVSPECVAQLWRIVDRPQFGFLLLDRARPERSRACVDAHDVIRTLVNTTEGLLLIDVASLRKRIPGESPGASMRSAELR